MAVRVSKTDFEEKVLKEKLPVLVDFYSDSCVACKKLAPVLGNAEDDYEDKIKSRTSRMVLTMCALSTARCCGSSFPRATTV